MQDFYFFVANRNPKFERYHFLKRDVEVFMLSNKGEASMPKLSVIQ